MCTWRINRQGIEQLGRSFSSIVILYPMKETMEQVHDTWGIPRTQALRHSESLESELNCAFFFSLWLLLGAKGERSWISYMLPEHSMIVIKVFHIF